jgi:hypothetical protein
MTKIADVNAYRDAVAKPGAEVIRMRLSTAEAVELAKSLDSASVRHPKQLAAAVADFAVTDPQPTEPEALLSWAAREQRRATEFWSAFEGEVVQGVEIIRRRA